MILLPTKPGLKPKNALASTVKLFQNLYRYFERSFKISVQIKGVNRSFDRITVFGFGALLGF